MNTEKKIAIIGVGYVGLPLALAFSKHFNVIGFDTNHQRITNLNDSIDANGDINFKINSKLIFTSKEIDLADSNIYILTVPTPVTKENNPDLSILKSASLNIAKYLSKGDIVIYESTVYPGVTEDICVPILETSGLKYNIDFYCGYSPERISPGANQLSLENIIKITSGSTPLIADIVDNLYKKIIVAGTYKAPTIRVAEAAKVVENTQRDVNIALMNELAMMFDKMDIDTNQVLQAAKTKWNFLDFKPGLVGGHCIGVDPYYLLHKSKEIGYKPTLLNSSRIINNSVANFVVEKTVELMIDSDVNVKKSSILVLGYTFKENCADIRNTKVKDIVSGLQSYLCNVFVFDPYMNINNIFIENPFDTDLKYDAIILAVAHKEFLSYSIDDFKRLSKGKLVFLDLKGIYCESSWKL